MEEVSALHTYVCFYRSHRATIQAATSYAAQREYARQFHVPENRRYLIVPMLAKKADGTDVIHSTAGLG